MIKFFNDGTNLPLNSLTCGLTLAPVADDTKAHTAHFITERYDSYPIKSTFTQIKRKIILLVTPPNIGP